MGLSRVAVAALGLVWGGLAVGLAQVAAGPSAGLVAPGSAPGAVPGSVPGAVPGSVKLSFEFVNPGLSPSEYRIELDGSGVGHYHSEPGSAASPDAHGAMPEAFDQQIEVSAPMREQLLAVLHSRRFLAGQCESRQNKVAFTGNKTIGYVGPQGRAGCTFNWSQDGQLMKVAGEFQAISLTLEEGRKLRMDYLHDRLSLDAELETLAEAVKNGTAVELENIAPELESIASDGAVMKRAQARAAALLALAPPVAVGAAAPVGRQERALRD